MGKVMSMVVLAGLVATGLPACATKGFVRTRIGEVNGKVNDLAGSVEATQERTKKNEAAIGAVDQKAQADAALTTAVRGLFAVAENYPELKANTSFMQLQGRITEIENSIADRREFYNDSVNTFNIRIAQFPDMIVAGMMHLTPRTLFKADEADKADVKMDFSTAAGKP